MTTRVLAITPASYIGGTEKVTLDVLSGLKDNNFQIHCIINGWNDNDFPSRLQKMNIVYTPIKLGWYYLKKIRWSIDSLIHYPRAVIKFLEVIKSFKHDVVYLTTYRSIILLYPLLKKNIIYHVHECNSNNKQSKILLKIADKKVVKYIAVSDFIKLDLILCGIDKSKIEVVYNGIDIPVYSKKERSEIDGPLAIGIVGQIIPRKGHEDVLEALKILREKGYVDVRLKIVGKGDIAFEEKLKRLIENYQMNDLVFWKGYEKDMIRIYDGIDVLIAPTRNEEPFGLVAIEANAMNIPVIVSKKGGLVEIVEDKYNGFIVDAYSPNQIAERIIFFYDNPKLQKKMGERGREKVSSCFTKKQMLLNFISIISKL